MGEPPDGLVTALQAAELLDVPSATIRQWKKRGLVVQADAIPGRGRSGRVPLFRLDELRPLAEAYRARRPSPRLIDNCPVCGDIVARLVTAGGSPSAIAMPCYHAVTMKVRGQRTVLTTWAPRRV